VKRYDVGLPAVVARVDGQLSHGMDSSHEVFTIGAHDRVNRPTTLIEDLEVTCLCHLEAPVCHRMSRIQ
jgi:hypothetical protein